MSGLLPWHTEIWRALYARVQTDELPHALLINGLPGLGKRQFAETFAAGLLCARRTTEGQACGACSGCYLYAAGTHPDLVRVVPEEEGKGIAIDQVRELREFLFLSSHAGGYKILIIDPAERMNLAASNALLKTLEEPVGRTVLLLITARPSALLATVRSRCQRLDFKSPARALAHAWLLAQLPAEQHVHADRLLALAHGAPLRALKMANENTLEQRARILNDLKQVAQGHDDPIRIAEQWTKLDFKETICWFTSVVIDLVRLKFAYPPTLLTEDEQVQALHGLVAPLEAVTLFGFLDQLRQTAQGADQQLNIQMLLENALIAWERIFPAPAGP